MATLYSRFKTYMEANIGSLKVIDGHIQQWCPSVPFIIFYEGQPNFPTLYDENETWVRIWPFRAVLVSNTEANLETLMEGYNTYLITYSAENAHWTPNQIISPWAKHAGYKGVEVSGNEEMQMGVTSW